MPKLGEAGSQLGAPNGPKLLKGESDVVGSGVTTVHAVSNVTPDSRSAARRGPSLLPPPDPLTSLGTVTVDPIAVLIVEIA